MNNKRADRHQVLSTTTIAVWAGGLLALAAVVVTVLWTVLGSGQTRDTVRLDVIRTAASIVVGTGGAAALLLAARRQRVTEIDVRQRDLDATERRVTELYGRAADQLGSDKAPVRLAGLYGLERLAQENPAHRQTIVDLFCAYLRMPARPLPRRGDEEAEVRGAAQDILARHLRPGDRFWPDTDLNLTGATLTGLVLTHCELRSIRCAGTTFIGPTTFRGTAVAETADFRDARFVGLADFRRVDFGAEPKPFRGSVFEGEVDFGTTTSVSLAGARTRTARGLRRKWPAGWVEREVAERQRSWATLEPVGDQRNHTGD
ncbi:pentapeptide repeat-containing protein [Actinophytocola gossypii]|uniref:Pentapeptide repeat-containing protein n=1 Tax=Actinophytocola gossypii TaxID=2812003 RepID=A0ABT2JGE4_9PSEU|nr:pentapeptide repeat-containing protein [Actinophytocola gossypii]MCT2586935.1 pentapeptide repeat-containing protein [Actinophytocola gossypii]